MKLKHIKQFNKAVASLLENFSVALASDYIRKPLAWALYQTWKEVDKKESIRFKKECEKERNRIIKEKQDEAQEKDNGSGECREDSRGQG